MQKLKIALIGCNGIGVNVHIPAFLEAENIEAVAVCDICRENAMNAAALLGLGEESVYEDYNDVLALDGLDAVDICTPNYLHSSIAVAALEKGLHVFCEKPDAINAAEAERMERAAEESGKVLMVMRNNRFANASVFLKKYIQDGRMGEIYTARCAWRRRRGIPGRGGWFTTKELSGGGPLIDLGVHGIDLAMWLMGNPKPVAVSGAVYNKFANNRINNDTVRKVDHSGTFDVEDLAMGFIRFENGAVMQIEFSWASNVEKETFFCELRGDKAGAYWESGKDLKIFGEEYGMVFDTCVSTSGKDNLHCKNIMHFADVVLNHAEPLFTPAQGVDMVKILDAMYKSADEGREIIL